MEIPIKIIEASQGVMGEPFKELRRNKTERERERRRTKIQKGAHRTCRQNIQRERKNERERRIRRRGGERRKEKEERRKEIE